MQAFNKLQQASHALSTFGRAVALSRSQDFMPSIHTLRRSLPALGRAVSLCAATGLCVTGGATVFCGQPSRDQPKAKEQVVKEYVASLQAAGRPFRLPLPWWMKHIFALDVRLFHLLAEEVIRNAEYTLGCGEAEVFFGHRVVKSHRYQELRHTGVGISFEMCDVIADCMLTDPRVNLDWLPDRVEKPMLISLCRLVSCMWFDMVLSLGIEIGKVQHTAPGLWNLEWSAADKNSHVCFLGSQGRDRVTISVADALARIDVEGVDAEASKMVTMKDSFIAFLVVPAEVSLYRTAMLVALTFVHLVGTQSEIHLGGVGVNAALASRECSKSTDQRE